MDDISYCIRNFFLSILRFNVVNEEAVTFQQPVNICYVLRLEYRRTDSLGGSSRHMRHINVGVVGGILNLRPSVKGQVRKRMT